MKKFLPYILILLVATGTIVGTFQPLLVEASHGGIHNDAFSENPVQLGKEAEARRGAGETPDEFRAEGSGGLLSKIFNFFLDIPLVFLKWVSYIILELLGALMGIVGVILNLVVEHLVVDMAETVKGITAINIAWKTFRDLANMLFIFILLYIAIATILRVEGYQAKNLLKNVIIIALLVNFSLFFTKTIIDGSNIVTLGFYNAITGGRANNVLKGISNTFMEPIRLQTIAKIKTFGDPGKNLANAPSFIVAAIGSAIIIAVTMFVFVALMVLLITRFVILIFLMILSPLAFAASVLPATRQYASKWWKTLFDQALFAPVVMALLWVSAMILNGVAGKQGLSGKLGGGESIGDALLATGETAGKIASNINPGAFNTFLNIFITIAFILASIIVAKQLGAKGGDAIINAAKRVPGFFGRTALRGGGALLRGTAGEGARKLDEKWRESKLGSTLVGDKVRQMTVEKLAKKAKFGTRMTAEEAHKETLYREERHEDATHRDNAITLMKGAKRKPDNTLENPEAIQREVIQMSTEAFARMPKKHLMDENFMKLATQAQFNAALSSKEYGTEEKKEFTRARFGHIFKHFDASEKYEKAKQNIELADRDGKPHDKNDDDIVSKGGPEMSKEVYDKLRALSQRELELMYWVNPDIVRNKELSAIRMSLVQKNRSSEAMTNEATETVRDTKDYREKEAADKIEGLGALPTAADVAHWKQNLTNFNTYLATVPAAEQALYAPLREVYETLGKDEISKLDHAGWEKLKTDKIRGIIGELDNKVFGYYKGHFSQKQNQMSAEGEIELDEALLERSPDEIMQAPGRIRKRVPIRDRVDAVIASTSTMKGKDTKDHELYIGHAIRAWGLEEQGIGTVTAANRELLRWLTTRRGIELTPASTKKQMPNLIRDIEAYLAPPPPPPPPPPPTPTTPAPPRQPFRYPGGVV